MIGHKFDCPVYFFEPIRLLVTLSIFILNKRVTLLYAFILPIFSFLIFGHPVFFKMMIMILEMEITVLVFLFFKSKNIPLWLSMLITINIGKLFYYIIQFFFISNNLLDAEQVEHDWLPQFGVATSICLIILVYEKDFLRRHIE